MADSIVWKPQIGNELHILIVTKPNFFDASGFAILNKVFEIEQTVESTHFYFDYCFRTETKLIQFLESKSKQNVTFIENYRHYRLDFGLIFGGDGSILWSNKYLKDYPYDLPVFTFNFGSVGFLSKFTLDEIDVVLDSLKSLLVNEIPKINFYIEYYPRIQSVVKNQEGKEIHRFSSINEIIVEKIGSYSNWLDVDIDGLHVVTLNADGLILCTQLGSTAYNASVHGPFLFPSNDNFVLSAIAPFAINFKSIVLNKDSKIRIRLSHGNYANEVKINADCNDYGTMNKHQELHIQIGSERLCIIHREENLKKQWVSKIAKLYKWI